METVTRLFRSNSSDTVDAELFRPAPRTRGYLLLLGSAASGGHPSRERLHLIADVLEVGRRRPRSGRSVRILVLDDPCVSAAHARLCQTARGFEVVDLDSRNGTFVDGIAVKRQRLSDGALLFFGGYAAVFRYLSADTAAAIQLDLREPFGPVPTASPVMATALRKLRRLAPTTESLLLTGETGTGKEVYARAIHRASGRRGKFVGLNCAAIPVELVESELFGYARGAHSQASQAKRGLIEQAQGGTLFLDEIGDMPRGAQAKLLRFLQEREVLPLGGAQARPVDVRVLAATAHVDGQADRPAVRKDLVMRLGTQPVVLPPLRARPEDIGALARHFLGPREVALDNSAFLAVCLHDWPGNVRELEKVVREAVALREGNGPIQLEHLPPALAGRLRPPARQPPPHGRRQRRIAPGRQELERLLERHEGRVADVARQLDRRWGVVWRWMKRHGFEPGQFRKPR